MAPDAAPCCPAQAQPRHLSARAEPGPDAEPARAYAIGSADAGRPCLFAWSCRSCGQVIEDTRPGQAAGRKDSEPGRWLGFFDLLQRLTAQARRCRCRCRDDGTGACGSREAFVFLGAEAGHARRSNFAARIFRPAADGVYPAEKRRRGYHTERWRVHCSREPFPGIPGADGGHAPGEGGAVGRMLVGGARPRPHAARAASRGRPCPLWTNG